MCILKNKNVLNLKNDLKGKIMKSIKKISFLLVVLFTSSIYSQCFNKINCRSYFNCTQKTDGSVWIFGGGGLGNLGNGTDTDEYSPVALGAGNSWQQFACGKYNTFAIKTNGTLWGTGNNYAGELGIGSTVDHVSVLTQIGTATNWKQIAPSVFFLLSLLKQTTHFGDGDKMMGIKWVMAVVVVIDYRRGK